MVLDEVTHLRGAHNREVVRINQQIELEEVLWSIPSTNSYWTVGPLQILKSSTL